MRPFFSTLRSFTINEGKSDHLYSVDGLSLISKHSNGAVRAEHFQVYDESGCVYFLFNSIACLLKIMSDLKPYLIVFVSFASKYAKYINMEQECRFMFVETDEMLLDTINALDHKAITKFAFVLETEPRNTKNIFYKSCLHKLSIVAHKSDLQFFIFQRMASSSIGKCLNVTPKRSLEEATHSLCNPSHR
jgi:hypothetical protein